MMTGPERRLQARHVGSCQAQGVNADVRIARVDEDPFVFLEPGVERGGPRAMSSFEDEGLQNMQEM